MTRSVLFFCALSGASLTLCSCRETKSTFTTKAGEHNVMISKIVLLSAPSDIHWCVGGNGCFSCESLDLKVTLEKEVLTVNGKRYVIPYKDDSIKVVDDRGRIEVEVNGQLAEPKGGS